MYPLCHPKSLKVHGIKVEIARPATTNGNSIAKTNFSLELQLEIEEEEREESEDTPSSVRCSFP
jgi:hypothetical protein